MEHNTSTIQDWQEVLLLAEVSSVKLHPLLGEGRPEVKHPHSVSPSNQSLHQMPPKKATPTNHHCHLPSLAVYMKHKNISCTHIYMYSYSYTLTADD